jgi:hypothetical protein
MIYDQNLGSFNKVGGTYPGGSIDGYLSRAYNYGFAGTWSGSPSLPGLYPCSESSSGDFQLNVGDNKTYPIEGYWTCGNSPQWHSIIGRRVSEQTGTQAGTSETNGGQLTGGSCQAECKDRDAHLIWNGKNEYPYCNCVCENSWEFDASGKNCVPSGTSGTNADASQIQIVTREGTTAVKLGDKKQVTLSSGDKAELEAKCENLIAMARLMEVFYGNWNLEPEDFSALQSYQIFLFIAYSELNCAKLQGHGFQKEAEFDSGPSISTAGSAVQIELELEQGPLSIEVVNDQVSLDVKTASATVSSLGVNTFDVGYDPASGRTVVAAHNKPISVQPSGGQGPFTLQPNQMVVVEANGAATPMGAGQAGTSGQAGGSGGRTPIQLGGLQGGCHTDPATGQIICIERISDFAGSEGTDQGDLGGGIPQIPAGQPSSTSVLDHTISGQVDESTYLPLDRTNHFSSSDQAVYSWLSLGPVNEAHTLEWRWFSPTGSLFTSTSAQVPAPSGRTWSHYDLYALIPIAGTSVAAMSGSWRVDIYLDGQRILQEQFTIGSSGGMAQQPESYDSSQGGCHTDPVTGQIICIDRISDFAGSERVDQGGCYIDPYTGEITCVDRIGDFAGQEGIKQGGCFTDPETGMTVCIN